MIRLILYSSGSPRNRAGSTHHHFVRVWARGLTFLLVALDSSLLSPLELCKKLQVSFMTKWGV